MDLINGFGRASPGFGSDLPIRPGRAWGSLQGHGYEISFCNLNI